MHALRRKEEALDALASEPERFYRLADVAALAFDAGDFDKSSKYARELLEMAPRYQQNWNYGNAVHKGNITLGRLALRTGDVDQAKAHLLSAGRTIGSPQLNSFGPSMSLAKELLGKGENEAVRDYLQLVRSFWKMDNGKIDQWDELIKKEELPDFGPNLSF